MFWLDKFVFTKSAKLQHFITLNFVCTEFHSPCAVHALLEMLTGLPRKKDEL